MAGGHASALGLPVLGALHGLVGRAAGERHAVGILLRIRDRLGLRGRRGIGGTGRRSAVGMGRRRKQADHDDGRKKPEGLLHSY